MTFSSDRPRSVDKAEELEAFLPDQQSEGQRISPSGRLATWLRYAALVAGAASYLFLLSSFVRTWNRTAPSTVAYADAQENIYVDAPLQTHRRMMNSKGLPSYFNTPDDPQVQQDLAEWHRDLSVGMLAITEEELAKMPGKEGSAAFHDPQTSRQVDGLYVVQTAASHQMTCLKIIHDTIWELAVDGVKDPYSLQHADHCIGYLRQLVRCHPDLTPIRFTWVEEHHAYMTGTGKEEHMCRSWDAIWDWQKGRNTTGVLVVGKHASLPGASGHHLQPGGKTYKAEWH